MKKILYITLLILSSIGWAQSPPTNNYGGVQFAGVAVLNPGGGETTVGKQGLRIVITAAGNMQIKYLNKNQMNGNLFDSESQALIDYTAVPGFTHGISLTIGNTIFRSGSLYPIIGNRFPAVLPTITNGPGNTVQTWSNNFTFKVGALNYLLKVTYTYTYPQTRLKVTYDITIPTGNTLPVQLAHGWDTQLNGGDNDSAPGYKYIAPGNNREAVGVRIHPYFDAMIYDSGTRWNGVYSGEFTRINNYLQAGGQYGPIFNAFDADYVEPSQSGGGTTVIHPDNGYGMSIPFGTTPGTYSTTNYVTFTCNAPPGAPSEANLPAGPGKTSTTNNVVLPTTTYTLTCADATQDIFWNGALPTPMIDENNDGVNDIEIQYFRVDPTNENNYTQLFPTADNKLLVTGNSTPAGAKYRIRYYDNYNKCTSTEREVIVKKPACSSDLSIVKTVTTLDTNSTVQPGKTYTITYTARNNGASDNGGVIVTDNVPAGFTITGTNIPAGTTYSNGVWNIGTITSGTSNGPTKILVLTVTANNYGPHISTATISGASTDSNLLNNTSKPLVYLDSDKDGIPNGDGTATSDLDSDNDGIPDSLEKQACTSPSSILSFTGYKAVLYDNATKYGFDILDSWTEVNAASTFPTTNYHQIATFDYYEHEKKNNAFDISFDIPNLTNIGFTAANSTKIRNFQGTGIKSNTENYDFAVMFNKAITTEEAGTYQINLTEGDNHIFIYKNGVKDIGYKDVWNTTPRPSRSITLAVGDILSILLIEEGAWNTQINAVITKTSGGLCMKDTDLDGIPDHLDLDSDADGCPDAIEGDENVLPTQLNADGSINYAANGGLGAIATNLGVPNLVNSGGAADIGGDVGQGIGTSANAAASSCPAAIRITKDNGQTLYKRPSTSTYTITVANEGSGTVNDIHFTDIVPSTFGTADFDYSATVTSGSTVRKLLTDATGTTVSGTGSVDNYINLLPGGVATYTVKLKISDEKRGDIRNVASIALPGSLVNSLPNTDDDIDSPGIDGRNDSFSNSTINPNKGGVAGVVIANDMINDIYIDTPTKALYTLNNNGGISGASINTNGELIIPTGVPAGVYTLQYTICNATTPTDCDTASILVEIFVDSDGDGVSDVIDFDDDNDGITDLIEASACGATSTKYFNEDFGTGARANFTGLLGTTNYIYEAGPYTGATSTSIEDGEYALLPNLDNVASWASTPDNTTFGRAWARTYDHTSENGTGRMALFNASRSTSEEFYNVNNITVPTNTSVKLTFWAKNVDLKTMHTNWDKNRSLPNIRVKVLSNGVLIREFTTGTILRDEQWHLYSVPFNTGTHTNIQFVMYNDMEGGLGNDLALDDIAISTICDSDGDGIPNELDLDSDNDGCTDAIEGAANITASQLVTATGLLATQNPNKNLGNTVDVNGIPTIVNGGQQIGNAFNAAINDCKCIKPAVITGTALDTNVGISTIGTTTGWPQNRKGAYLALESQGKGLVISRLTTTQITAIGVNSQEGMMVYDTDVDCLKIYSKDIGAATYSWKCFDTQSCPDN